MPPGPSPLLVRPSFSVSLPSPTRTHACSCVGGTRDPVLGVDRQLGPGHLPDVVPQHTGGPFDDRRRLLRQDDDGTGLTFLDESDRPRRCGEKRSRQDHGH